MTPQVKGRLPGSKQAARYAKRDDHIEDCVTNQVIAGDNEEEFSAPLPYQFPQSMPLCDEQALNYAVLVESKQRILLYQNRSRAERIHGGHRVVHREIVFRRLDPEAREH